jgi:hypothetical protein
MNRNVCLKCRRYLERSSVGFAREGTWLCAKLVRQEESDVIPGHSFWRKDLLHPISESTSQPPDWCERALEQVILPSDAEVDIMGDKNIVFDGNDAADYKRKFILGRKKDSWSIGSW